MNFPVATKEKFVKKNNGWALEFYVFSPRPLDDLLIEPNMPKLSLMLKAKTRELSINDKPYASLSYDGRNEVIYKELPLLQGWNKLVITIGDGDRNDFSGFFQCDNKKDFLPTLKAITDRQPDTGRLCQSIHREYQPSAGSHVSYHSIAKQYASCLSGTC